MTRQMTVLDLPIEKQKELAQRSGKTLATWQEETRAMFKEMDEFMSHVDKEYMDEETSKHFANKMKSATQDV